MTTYKSRPHPSIYRKIYEQHFGPIPKDELGRSYHIHHKDGNPFNNDPSNLEALSCVDHQHEHFLGVPLTEEHKNKLRETMLMREQDPEWIARKDEMRTKMSIAAKGNKNHLGHTHTPEARSKMDGFKGRTHTPEARAKIAAAGRRPCSEETKRKISEARRRKKAKLD